MKKFSSARDLMCAAFLTEMETQNSGLQLVADSVETREDLDTLVVPTAYDPEAVYGMKYFAPHKVLSPDALAGLADGFVKYKGLDLPLGHTGNTPAQMDPNFYEPATAVLSLADVNKMILHIHEACKMSTFDYSAGLATTKNPLALRLSEIDNGVPVDI